MANKYYAPVRKQQSVITPMVAGFALDLVKQKMGAAQAAKLNAGEQAAQTARSDAQIAGRENVATIQSEASAARNRTDRARANLQHTIALKQIEGAKVKAAQVQDQMDTDRRALKASHMTRTPEQQMAWEAGVKAKAELAAGGDKGFVKTLTPFINSSKNLTAQGAWPLHQLHHFSNPETFNSTFRETKEYIQKKLDKAALEQDAEGTARWSRVATSFASPAGVQGAFPAAAHFEEAQKRMAAQKTKAGAPKESALGTLRRERSELEPGDTAGLAEYSQRIAKENMPSGSNKSIEVSPEGGVTISEQSGSGLTQGTKTTMQKDVAFLADQLGQVEQLGESFKRDYLTYQGKVKGFTLNKMSRADLDIGDEGREFVAGARVFKERIEGVFNRYRKEITGAQAAIKEIKMLRDSILNKDLSPDEFQASLGRYTGEIKRSMRLKRQLLRDGIKGNNLAKTLDTKFTAKEDVPSSEIDFRGDEIEKTLMKKGLTGTELENGVVNVLKTEGYL